MRQQGFEPRATAWKTGVYTVQSSQSASAIKRPPAASAGVDQSATSIQGYVLGFLIAVLQIVGNVYMKKRKMSKMSMVCLTASTVFVVQYFYYILSPKSDWILLHLDTAEQKEKWLNIYRSMQYNCHISVALGIVAAGALAYSFC